MKKVIIIVDAYTTGRFLAPRFQEKGFTCVHVQSRKNTIACYLNSYQAHDFIRNIVFQGDIEALLAELGDYEVHAVVPGAETGVLLADELTHKLGLPGNDSCKLATRRDKYTMQEQIKTDGVRGVQQSKVTSFAQARTFAESNGFPLIIKPLDSSGSHGVRFCHDLNALREAFASCKENGTVFGDQCHELLVQEFLDGKEYVVNAVSKAGQHYLTDVYIVHKTRTHDGILRYDHMDMVTPAEDVYQPLVDYIFAVLTSLGIREGASHSEVIMTASGPVLVETNARLMGSLVPEVVEQAYGFSHVSKLVDAIVEPEKFIREQDQLPDFQTRFRQVYFNNDHEMTVQTAADLSSWQALPTFARSSLHLSVGKTLPRSTSLADYLGYVYLVGDFAQIARDTQTMRQEFTQILASTQTSTGKQQGENPMLRRALITLTTDFGKQTQGLGQMRMVMANINAAKNNDPMVIDYMHGLQAHSVHAAARTMQTLAQVKMPNFSPRAHVCVVDPGVGTQQKRIIIETKDGDFLIGPNNGALLPAADAFGGIERVVEIANPALFNPHAMSDIFHGRDRFAPAAAHLANGVALETFGPEVPIAELIAAPFTEATISADGNIQAEVIQINSYGTAHLNIEHAAWDAWLAKYPTKSVSLQLGATTLELPIVKTFGEVEKGQAVILKDDYGRVCVAINQGRFCDVYELNIGDSMAVQAQVSVSATVDKEVDKAMTEKHYLKHPQQLQNTTQLVSVDKDDRGVFVRLAATVFHPQGGGQKGDIGKIGDYKVVDVRHADDKTEVNHYLDVAAVDEVKGIDEQVACEVDLAFRAKSAVLHTVGHYLGNVLEARGAVHPSGHHFHGEAKVEAQIGDMTKPEKAAFEQELQDAFAKMRTEHQLVKTQFDEAGNRSVQIGDNPAYPCGGTHLSSMAMVESMSLRYVKVKKGKISVGYDAEVNLELYKAAVKKQQAGLEQKAPVVVGMFAAKAEAPAAQQAEAAEQPAAAAN